MIIYSVSASVEKKLEDEWLLWMKETHIPGVIATGHFDGHDLHQVLEPMVDPDSVTYNILYYAKSASDFDSYQKNKAPSLQSEYQQKYGNSCPSFRSILKRI